MFKISLNKTREAAQLSSLEAEAPRTRQRVRIAPWLAARPEIWLLVILNLIVFARFFSPQVIAVNDWVFWNKHTLEEYKYLTVWGNQEGLGRDELFAIPHVFQQFFLYYLSFSAFTSNLSDHFFWFLILPIFSNISAYLFFNKITGARIVVFFSTLLYTLNTEYLARLAGGHNLLWYGYALAPLILWLFVAAVEKRKLFYFLLSGCAIAFTFVYDFRTDLILSILFAGFIFFQFVTDKAGWKQRILFYLKGVLCIVIVPAVLSAFFVIPTILITAPSLPAGNTSLEAIQTFSYADIWHALTLVDPFWPTFAILNTKFPVPVLFYSLPLLALLSFWLRRRDKYAIFFAFVYVSSVFLAKGANPPFGEINEWIFTHIPGFFAFREATKFFMVVSLALSYLVGVGIGEIANRIPKWQALKTRAGLPEFTLNLFLLTALAIFLVMLKPALLQETQGSFVSYSLPQWQQQIEASQVNDHTFYRTLWIPSREAISPFSSQHPIIGGDTLSTDPTMRPFIQLGDPAPDNGWTYLHQHASANLLNLLGVKYVYVPNTDYQKVFSVPPADTSSKTAAQLQTAKNFLDMQGWLRPITNTTTLTPAYQTAASQDHFFATQDRTYVVGPDDFFTTLDSLPKMDFATQTLIPIDTGLQASLQPGHTLIFNQTTMLDYVITQLPKSSFLEPYQATGVSDFDKGDPGKVWDRVRIDNKYSEGLVGVGLQSYDFDYDKGVIYTKSGASVSLTFNLSAQQAGASRIFLRTLDNADLTDLEIKLDDQNFSLTTRGTNNTVFRWHEVGSGNFTAGSHTLTIIAKSGTNAVNLVAIANVADFNAAQDGATALIKQSKLAQIQKLDAAAFQRQSLTNLVGTATWDIPVTGSYRPSIHVPAGATLSKIAITIDATRIVQSLDVPQTGASSGQGTWSDLSSLNLTAGPHQVSLELQEASGQSSSNYTFPLDYVLLTRGDQPLSQLWQTQTQPATLTYDYLSPTKYLVHIKNATRPFDLVFAEAYNNNWTATYAGVKGQRPETAYEMVQAYQINQTGSFDVTIEYRTQKYVYLGMLVSAVGLLVIIGALVLFRRRGW